eukprot:scaffold236_cov419-Prasinococcus_capsulatus_cf.AAC.19
MLTKLARAYNSVYGCSQLQNLDLDAANDSFLTTVRGRVSLSLAQGLWHLHRCSGLIRVPVHASPVSCASSAAVLPECAGVGESEAGPQPGRWWGRVADALARRHVSADIRSARGGRCHDTTKRRAIGRTANRARLATALSTAFPPSFSRSLVRKGGGSASHGDRWIRRAFQPPRRNELSALRPGYSPWPVLARACTSGGPIPDVPAHNAAQGSRAKGLVTVRQGLRHPAARSPATRLVV